MSITRIAALLAPLLIVAALSCVSEVPIEGAPCPCAPGWTCDEIRQRPGVCVKSCTRSWEKMTSGTKAFLNAVWGTSANDVFAVGTNGTILHYDGSAWAPMASPTTHRLMGVWGTSATDVFAVGGDFGVSTALHYDGASWKDISPATAIDLSSVWGTSSKDIFASAGGLGTGGSGGMILHYDGASWQTMLRSISQVMSVWGLGPRNVFAVGRGFGDGWQGAEVWHYDGMNWSSISRGLPANLWTVRAVDSDSVLAVGNSVLRCTAAECTVFAPEVGSEGLWVAAPDCIYAVGWRGTIKRYDGKSWTPMEPWVVSDLYAVWAADCDHPFVVGADTMKGEGVILRYTCK